ncbi:ABC transporter substrate-binding protein [Paenibacillus sp. MER 99-2]|uniref:ABC transporter substrate-binding protein n=1 Tax=Paenibacillus sp. MER 99-2 TaxID=2939572 RepID=UPI00203F456F|nr:ABC transporter substrate-binding protein [Paenibacillus sp. MER 99-2]MCM3174764.1 ABC transporter substrate-binding protein [Paenibacillus sp. MER 99-2]
MRTRKWWISIILTSVFVLSACSNGSSTKQATPASSSTETTAASSSTTGKGGDAIYALATSPDTLDPARSGLAVAIRVYRTLFDNLVVKTEDGTIKPWLATEWEESEDHKTYTLKLREGVKFHDGTSFNAEAVKFSLDRILDPNTKAGNSAALIVPYESSEIIDEYTIQLNLSQPSRAFLGNLSQAALSIVSPTAVEKYGDQFGQHPVGTGPFKFVKWDENAQVQVERNTDYAWAPETVENKSAPYLNTLTFKILPEEATRVGSLQSGQVTAIETVPPQNVLALEKQPGFQLLKVNTPGLPYTLFINQNKEPWNELKARQGLQYGIDVSSIVKTLYLGTYEQAWSALTPSILGYDASLENVIQPNQAKAAQLLDELGWEVGTDGIREKNGQKLTLHYVDGSPNREKRNDIAAMIQQQLKKIGVQVNVEITQDVGTIVFTNGDYDIYGNSQVKDDPHALLPFYHTAAPGARATLSNLSSPEVDEWLEQGAIEFDDTKRAEIYGKVLRYIQDNAIIIPIYIFPYVVGASDTLKGLKFDYLAYPIFNDVYVQ